MHAVHVYMLLCIDIYNDIIYDYQMMCMIEPQISHHLVTCIAKLVLYNYACRISIIIILDFILRVSFCV